MRMPEPGENLVGKVCICSIGRIAVVTGRQKYDWGGAWVGMGFDGKGTWASKDPCIAYDTIEDYRKTIEARFGGKMSFNS